MPSIFLSHANNGHSIDLNLNTWGQFWRWWH